MNLKQFCIDNNVTSLAPSASGKNYNLFTANNALVATFAVESGATKEGAVSWFQSNINHTVQGRDQYKTLTAPVERLDITSFLQEEKVVTKSKGKVPA